MSDSTASADDEARFESFPISTGLPDDYWAEMQAAFAIDLPVDDPTEADIDAMYEQDRECRRQLELDRLCPDSNPFAA